jgi:hypothetical protein
MAARTEWYSDVDIAKAVEVGVSRCLNHFSRVPVFYRDRIPVLQRVVIRGSCGIEQPVALVTNERFHLVDVFAVALDADPDDVSVALGVNSR